ncbi:MAG: hypothetical protein HC835_05290 [Oscillatoriales cyanobacterium RM2_1_1]|nr:hypothetical protein [Oscillatoriales cyanobacterium SM2_3_0]NJO45078.1 hypothetical protein [Oscillatoriales cyanobacterium RM2_1_1]
MKISCWTGNESHTSYEANGIVYVMSEGFETQICKAAREAALIRQQLWEGNNRNHTWVASQYELAEGSILKFWATLRHKGKVEAGGGVFMKLDSKQPLTRVTMKGSNYKDRQGWIEGQFLILPHTEFKIQRKLIQYYQAEVVVERQQAQTSKGTLPPAKPLEMLTESLL